MNRRTKFITGAVTAILTFAALTLTFGQRHHNHWRDRHGHHACSEHSVTKSDSTSTEKIN